MGSCPGAEMFCFTVYASSSGLISTFGPSCSPSLSGHREGKMMERLNACNQADTRTSACGSVTFAVRRLLSDICAPCSRSLASVC